MQKMIKKLSKSNQGFTLIELIVVIAILGILAAVLVPTVGNIVSDAQQNAADSDASTIYMATQLYQTDALNKAGTALAASTVYVKGTVADKTGTSITGSAVPTSLSGSTYFASISSASLSYAIETDANGMVKKVTVNEHSKTGVYPK